MLFLTLLKREKIFNLKMILCCLFYAESILLLTKNTLKALIFCKYFETEFKDILDIKKLQYKLSYRGSFKVSKVDINFLLFIFSFSLLFGSKSSASNTWFT